MQPIPQYNTPASSGWPAESYPVLPNAGGQYQDGMHLASFNPYPSYDNGALDQQQNIGNDGTQPSAFPYPPSVPGSFSEACQGPMPSHDEHQPTDENTWNFPQLNGLAGYPLDNASLVGAPRDYHGTGPSTSLIADASAFPIDSPSVQLPASSASCNPSDCLPDRGTGSFNPFDLDQVHAQGIEGSLHLGASSFAQLPAADTSNTATIGPNEAYSLTYLLGDTGTTLDDNSIWPASNIQLTGASISSPPHSFHHRLQLADSNLRSRSLLPYGCSAGRPSHAVPVLIESSQDPDGWDALHVACQTPCCSRPYSSHPFGLAPHTPFLSGLPLASTSASFPAGDLGNYPFANQYPQATPFSNRPLELLPVRLRRLLPIPGSRHRWSRSSAPTDACRGCKGPASITEGEQQQEEQDERGHGCQTAIAAEAVEGQVQQSVEMVHCTMHREGKKRSAIRLWRSRSYRTTSANTCSRTSAPLRSCTTRTRSGCTARRI
ncbi:unnamed protein product [Mycena citricolor]|uniref:Uncharacterized protein n=1 Tax=Mycena citricolor TaxID=2018698 RepID=A0AAD2Q518_9AGAR|nr:unnamed protein product [Mycena citricolor]